MFRILIVFSIIAAAIPAEALAQPDPRAGVSPPQASRVVGSPLDEQTVAGVRAADGLRSDFAEGEYQHYQCPNPPFPGEVCHDLTIAYGQGGIYNPLLEDTAVNQVRLRSYVETRDWLLAQQDASVQVPRFLAPEIRIRPGRTFRLTLRNRLPKADALPIPGHPGETCATLPPQHDINQPHCANYDRTNMHAHGLWISPQGNSDNVHLAINPGHTFQYEYNIPFDHPAGTFWYHPHLHGSTAPQVASGMVGALIIEGDRLPRWNGDAWIRPGDLDVLLGNTTAGAEPRAVARDRTLLFQQISYGCRDAQGRLAPELGEAWYPCTAEATGTLEPGPTTTFDTFGPGSWRASGRFTSVNGGVWPIFGLEPGSAQAGGTAAQASPRAVAGRPERWRLIHGGVRDTIRLKLRRIPGSEEWLAAGDGDPEPTAAATAQALRSAILAREDESLAELRGPARDARRSSPEDDTDLRARIVERLCASEANGGDAPLTVYGVASDGLTRRAVDVRTETTLQPGYREDLLVVFPRRGVYCLIDAEVEPDASVETFATSAHGQELLGYVVVDPAPAGDPPVEGLGGLVEWLVANARAHLADPALDAGVNAVVIGQVVADLENEVIVDGVRTRRPLLSAFVRHSDVADSELTPAADGKPASQTLGFNVDLSNPAPRFEIGRIGRDASGGLVLEAPTPYRHDAVRTLALNTAEEWWLTSFLANHPFHIHVNPFQITGVWAYKRRSGCGDEDERPGCRIDPADRATWVDMTLPGAALVANTQGGSLGQLVPSQYVGMKGIWRDTILVEQDVLITIRTRYQRYIGDFVLHCHILDHEDEGMMENVRIVLGTGEDATAGSAHGAAYPAHGGHH